MPRILSRNYPYSLNLSDNTHSVTIPNTANLTYGTSSMSYAFWFEPNGPIAAQTNVIVETDAASYNNGVMLSQFELNLYVYVQNGATSYPASGFFNDQKPGVHQRIGVSISAVDYKVRVYKNGVLWGTSTAITPWNITSTNPCRIGASGDLPQACKGKYTDFCFMKGTVPTDQQFADDYFLNKTLPNINHRYALNEGSGTSTIDSVGGNTGTINNGAAYSTDTPMKLRTIITGQNLITKSQDFGHANWSKTAGVLATTNTSDVADPNGGHTASKIVYDGSGVAGNYRIYQGTYIGILGRNYTDSVWLRTASGTVTLRLNNNSGTYQTINIDTTWRQFSLTTLWTSGAVQLLLYSPVATNTAFTVYAWQGQIVEANWVGPICVTDATIINNPIRDNVGDLRNIAVTQQNLFIVSEPQALGDVYSSLNVTVDNYTWPSQIVTTKAITFGDNTASRTSYMYYAGGDGITPHTFGIDIVMDDASAPVALASAGTSDFQLYFNGAIVSNAVTTSLGGNLYRVSFTGVPAAANVLYGLLKTGSHSAKGFKASGFHMVKGNQLGVYKKTYGAAYDIGNLRNVP